MRHPHPRIRVGVRPNRRRSNRLSVAESPKPTCAATSSTESLPLYVCNVASQQRYQAISCAIIAGDMYSVCRRWGPNGQLWTLPQFVEAAGYSHLRAPATR